MKVTSDSSDYRRAVKAVTSAFMKFINTDLKTNHEAEFKILNSDEHAIIELYRYSVCKALSLRSVLNYASLTGVVDITVKVIEKELIHLDLSTEEKRAGFLTACVSTIKAVADSTFFDKTGRR